tara:strand:+ start:1616 stop:2275 length:660 start_codon:yes stop_codon:yes gene_type:complete
MNLTFPEILDENFENKIKEIKNKVKNVFKKDENKIISTIKKNPNLLISIPILTALVPLFLLGVNNALAFLFFLLGLIMFIFNSIIIINILENNNIRKNETNIRNVANYYDKKSKKINSKKVKEMIDKLNKKEQEILYIINNKDMINKKDLKIKNEILKSKIKESSILEIEKYESLILSYLKNLEDKKQVKEIEKLLNSRLKEKENYLFEEKEEKIIVNI